MEDQETPTSVVNVRHDEVVLFQENKFLCIEIIVNYITMMILFFKHYFY